MSKSKISCIQILSKHFPKQKGRTFVPTFEPVMRINYKDGRPTTSLWTGERPYENFKCSKIKEVDSISCTRIIISDVFLFFCTLL